MKKYDIHHKRPGALLADKEKHEEEHKNWSRREFLRTTGLFSFALSTTLAGFPLLAAEENSFLHLFNTHSEDRILVLIQLNGGNDGLNTVIDRFNDKYYQIRPGIAIQENNLWALSDKIGMPLVSDPLRTLWDAGQMKVIQNVGYPNPNYSHFRSSDIWASASPAEEVVNTGWIGRFLEEQNPAFLEAQPVHPPAIQIGVQTDLVFRGENLTSALALRSPEEFYRLASSGNLYNVNGLDNTPAGRELKYVRQTANSAFRYSSAIKDAYNKGQSSVAYLNHYFSQSLNIVAKLIKGGLKTKVYMVNLYGFDTHANQISSHENLMRNLAAGVTSFYEDLGQEKSKSVLSMTFSEFGRTIYENASAGTDHGTGAPIFLFGGEIGQGFIGNPPDLNNLDHYGDPFFEIDFKDVYNTVLQSWFGMDPRLTEFLMGQKQNHLMGMLPPYNAPKGANAFDVIIGHRLDPQRLNTFNIQFGLPASGPYILELTDSSGQVVRKLSEGLKEAGIHIYNFDPQQKSVKPGKYFYRLKFAGKVYRRVIYI